MKSFPGKGHLMLIQCQSCNAKYRLNLGRIPKRKTFIKCKKCSGPIYVDPQEGDAQQSSPPAAGQGPGPGGSEREFTASGDDLALVTCDNCGARYRVPVRQLTRPGLKLKCTSCDNMFPVPEGLVAGAQPQTPPQDLGRGSPPADFYPSSVDSVEQVDGEKQMPLPDDSRVSTMFDDLKVNLGAGQPDSADDATSFDAPSNPSRDAGVGDPERAYLDAISFTDDGSLPTLPSRGSLSDDKKYRFFLKPNVEGDDDMAAGQNPENDELPPLDDDEQTLAAEVQTDVQGEPPFVPPLPDDTDAGGTEDIPPLPAVREEPTAEHPNSPVQEISQQTENTRYRMLWVAVLLVTLIGVGWGAWLWMLPGSSESFAVRDGTPAEFTVTNTKKGYFITNKPSGRRLFVLTGEVVNGFDASDQVGWIRLKGTAVAKGKAPQESFSYIGNILNDNQLATWALPAIKAYYGYLNGRDDKNYHVPRGTSVPYQIVLAGVRQPIERTSTQLVSYQHRGLPVYVEQYQ